MSDLQFQERKLPKTQKLPTDGLQQETGLWFSKIGYPRFYRPNRPFKFRQQNNEDNNIQFDQSKDLKDNIKEVLTNVCHRNGVPAAKKLAYLNAFVKLITDTEPSEYGFSVEDIFLCLRVGLVHETMQVRAATLRCLRYMFKKEEDVILFNKLNLPYLLARSLDVARCNEMEQVQALRLVRRILVLAPRHFSPTLARSLESTVNTDLKERKDSFYVYLAILCELGVLNVNVLVTCGGVGALVRVITIEEKPAVVEAVLAVLLRLLTNPETRGNVSLLCLAAPYCELETVGGLQTQEDWDKKFLVSKSALLSLLRSYPGVIHFCQPTENTGLRAIVDILYVERLEVRRAVLELFYELLEVPLPIWTDEPDVAVAAVNPSNFRESWKLSEGFVAAEGKSVLPSLMSHCPNITELQLALLVHILLECGLARALAETIVTSDTFISVRSAVLLGMILHLAYKLLPQEVYDAMLPLPNLLEHASTGRHQALGAVTILNKIHSMMRRVPAPSSLFLDRLLQQDCWLNGSKTYSGGGSRRPPTLPKWIRRLSPMPQLLRDSQVLTSKDALAWNWSVVRSVLRNEFDNSTKIVHDSDHRTFIKKLVRYFKPTSNLYSRIELATNTTLVRETTLAGCELINCLITSHPEGSRLLFELVDDIVQQIRLITESQSAHDCLFSPRHVTTTCCQNYFLFIGQLSSLKSGLVMFQLFGISGKLQELALKTNHECYVKLIVSCLDYSKEGPHRLTLNTIACDSNQESTRLYATQFLRLIVRANAIDASKWAISLLVGRLEDPCKEVAFAALAALHEACENVKYLEMIYKESEKKCQEGWDEWLQNLGDQGYLLKIRFYSIRSAFANLAPPAEELEKWIKDNGFAERYTGLIEAKIHDSIVKRHRLGVSQSRWKYEDSTSSRDVFIMPHLVGQLVQHEFGLQLLLRRNIFQRFLRVIQRFRMEFGDNNETNVARPQKEIRCGLEDSYMSEESAADELGESYRLETILDSEPADFPEIQSPQKSGASLLQAFHRKLSLDDSIRTTPERNCKSESENNRDEHHNVEAKLLKVKAAVWALGHAATSPIGVEHLNHLGIVELLVCMAESCPYYSIRATAIYAISLIGTTKVGADILTSYDWPCVRYARGQAWPVVGTTSSSAESHSSPSPVPIHRHHRSLSDGRPDYSENTMSHRTRIRSESAASDFETCRRYLSPERADTPSPMSSINRLSQQDAEGYQKLRSLHFYRRPSYSHSSLETHSLDGKFSSQSLNEFESSHSWTGEPAFSPSPPPATISQENEVGDCNTRYMGISLPKRLNLLFYDRTRTVYPPSTCSAEDKSKTNNLDVDSESFDYNPTEHMAICLVCSSNKDFYSAIVDSEEKSKLRKEVLRLTQHLANPIYCSRNALLRLRQNHPDIFQDTCIYSDVSSSLASNTYKIRARTFIQELFLDSSFNTLYDRSREILELNENVNSNDDKKSAEGSSAVNGRLASPVSPAERMAVVKNAEVILQERTDDEKIIAEILKPDEKMPTRSSKHSEKLMKVVNLD